jgi:hypothetical protein
MGSFGSLQGKKSPFRRFLAVLSAKRNKLLDFPGNLVALEAAGADLKGYRGAVELGFYLLEVRFPGAAGVVVGVAYLVPGDGVFSADIATP